MTESKITLKGKVLSVDVDKLILEFEELEKPIKHVVRLDCMHSESHQEIDNTKIYYEEHKSHTVYIKGDFIQYSNSESLFPEFFVVGTKEVFERRKF